MILYLDTSSLVKVYLDEPGYEETRKLVPQARSVATSLFLKQFERYWLTTTVIPVGQDTASSAAALAERHALRALDAIHLASATGLAERTSEAVVFLSADASLLAVAVQEGLATPT